MTFYILFEGDTEENTIYDRNTLGTISFNIFHANMGYAIMNRMIDIGDDRIKEARIVTSSGSEMDVVGFMQKIAEAKVTIKPYKNL